jgi:arsenical pump membrane protein
VLRRFFASELVGRGEPVAETSRPVPVFACAVVGLTLVGFFVASVLHVSPAFAALGGAVALAGPALVHRRATVRDLGFALDVPFLAFVLALGLVVKAVSLHGLSSLVGRVMPSETSLGSLLLVAALAAVLANVINNLPAVLLLLPAAAAAGPGEVLAVLIGVNAGPNLTYVGSLATLLWRRVLRQRGEELPTWEFLRLGAMTVPPVLLAATVVLWASLRLVG